MNPRLDGQPSRNPSGPYSQSASAYLHSGWWPIPVQGKNRPVAGATGKRGEVTQGRVKHWIRQLPTHNVGLRHEGTIAVDIDHHGDKTGAVTISRLEHAWGQLPPTLVVNLAGRWGAFSATVLSSAKRLTPEGP